MQTLIFTGAAGTTALAAAATAAAAARQGVRTLIASFGPAHSVAALARHAPSAEPQTLAPNLDLWALDALGDLGALYGQLRAQPGFPALAISGDEIPAIPGSDLFLGVTRLRQLAARGYELVCVDAGPPDALLRGIAVPDTFRWLVRIMIGLDRNPGRSSASVARALLPAALIPSDWINQVQNARVQLEQLRDESVDPAQARVRYLLRPDRAGLEEALISLPALQLYGLAVELVIAGPLLPEGAAQLALEELSAEQEAIAAEAAKIWAPRPLLRLFAGASPSSPDALAEIGDALYPDGLLLPEEPIAPTVRLGGPPDPSIALSLPGLRRETLGLTLSGDELIVRAGPYRRHILLPEGLRGSTNIRAARQGEVLIIRPRT